MPKLLHVNVLNSHYRSGWITVREPVTYYTELDLGPALDLLAEVRL